MRVYTACAKHYRGEDAFDIMRASAERGDRHAEPFAPPRWLLDHAKGRGGPLPSGTPRPPPRAASPLAYRDWYYARYDEAMEASERARPEAWAALCARAEVTLVCACENPSHCHRVALARRLVQRHGVWYEGERERVIASAP